MNRRIWLLALSILIVAAVAGLASSLHDVHFEPGRALPEAPTSVAVPPTLPVSDIVAKTPLWKLLLFWLALVINVFIFFFLLPPDVRKRILRQVVSFALGLLGILIALRYRLIQLPSLEGQPVKETNPAGGGGSGNVPMPVFQPPQMSGWWIFLVSFIVLTIMLALLWLAYRWWLRPGRYGSQLDAIGAIAQSSLGEIAAGRDWGDVIIQSYIRMSEAVSARRGLQRAVATTPREFAERLERAGLPAHAVARLTRLFESARYGRRASTQADINEAVACLNSILQACGQGQ